jgi:hypothetical protein
MAVKGATRQLGGFLRREGSNQAASAFQLEVLSVDLEALSVVRHIRRQKALPAHCFGCARKSQMHRPAQRWQRLLARVPRKGRDAKLPTIAAIRLGAVLVVRPDRRLASCWALPRRGT